jgi:hypothetical protein
MVAGSAAASKEEKEEAGKSIHIESSQLTVTFEYNRTLVAINSVTTDIER